MMTRMQVAASLLDAMEAEKLSSSLRVKMFLICRFVVIVVVIAIVVVIVVIVVIVIVTVVVCWFVGGFSTNSWS